MPAATGGVVNGQAVSQEITNPAFINANGNDNAQGIYDFINTDPASGPSILNVQREWNSIAYWVGKPINIAKDAIPTWTNSQGFTPSESVGSRVEALSQKFFNTTLGGGHSHDGSLGGGALVQAASIDGVILRGSILQAPLITAASGLSTNVSAQFIGKVASTGDTTKGVVVLPPNNKVVLRQGSGASYGDSFYDAFGNIVYGRLTEAVGVWTLTYFVDLSGVETAYSFGAPVDIILYYQQLFNPIFDAPIYSEYATIPSDNATSDVVDATATQRGLISAGTQSLGGNKTWVGTQLFNAIVTFAANVIMQARLFLSTETDAATTGSLATLPAPLKAAVRLTNVSLVSIQEISGGSDGLLFLAVNNTGVDIIIKNMTGTAGNQVKTGSGADFTWRNNATITLYYEGNTAFWQMAGGGSGFSLAAVGATPNANGASYNTGTGVFNLEPADSSFPGVMTAITQSFSGAKTWLGNMIMQAIIRFDTQTDSSTTGSNADLPSPVKGVLRLTNASLVSIQRVLTMGNEQVAVLINKTGSTITLINNFAAEGFLTGTGADMTVANDASVLLVKDSISSRVMVVGGSGGGSGGGIAGVQTITTNTAVVNTPTTPRQIVLIDATSGAVTVTLPAAAANTIGTEWVFKRTDAVEANVVTIQRAGADTIDEGNTQTLPYQYSRTSIRGLSATSWGVF